MRRRSSLLLSSMHGGGLLGAYECDGGAPCSSPLFLGVRPRDEPIHFAEGEHFPTFLIVVLNNEWNSFLKNIKLPLNGVHVSSSIPLRQ